MIQSEEVKQEDRLLTYEEREEIKTLSKMFLGSSSKWQKLEKKGTPVPKRDAEGKPIIVGYNKKVLQTVKVKNEKGEDVEKSVPSPMYLNEIVRTSPLELLVQLRAFKIQRDAAIEAQRKEQEAKRAVAKASGVANLGEV